MVSSGSKGNSAAPLPSSGARPSGSKRQRSNPPHSRSGGPSPSRRRTAPSRPERSRSQSPGRGRARLRSRDRSSSARSVSSSRRKIRSRSQSRSRSRYRGRYRSPNFSPEYRRLRSQSREGSRSRVCTSCLPRNSPRRRRWRGQGSPEVQLRDVSREEGDGVRRIPTGGVLDGAGRHQEQFSSQERIPWGDLPPDVLTQIASLTLIEHPVPDGESANRMWKAMREVCSSWKAGLDRGVTKICIKGSTEPDQDLDYAGARCITGTQNITMPDFQRFPSVQSLTLWTFRLNCSSLAGLRGGGSLTDLSLLACCLTPCAFEALQGIPLTKLDLGSSDVCSSCLRAITMLPVTSLGLSSAYDLRDSNLWALRGMTSLTELDLSGQPVANNISFEGFEALLEFPRLRVLKLQDWFDPEKFDPESASSEIADAVSRLPLTDLDVSDSEYEGGFVDDKFLMHLRCSQLKSLNLGYSRNISDKGLRGLEFMPLASLNLSYCMEITDKGILFLSIMGLQLTALNLAGLEDLTDESLRLIKDMPLTSLNLSSCRNISDAGLKYLWRAPLTDLNLHDMGKSITRRGLLPLRCKGMPLRYLRLNGSLWRKSPLCLADVATEDYD